MKKLMTLMAAGAALALAGSAQAQLSAWRINEVCNRTIGGASGAERAQFVELYHPVAGQSVTGLSLVVVQPRFNVAEEGGFIYRVDLSGTASTNFYVVGDNQYQASTTPTFPTANQIVAGDNFMRPGGATQGQFQEVHLVLTSSIDPSYTPVTATVASSFQFNSTHFNNGADLIDGVYLCGSDSVTIGAADNGAFVKVVPGTDPRIAAHPNPATLGAAPPGAKRATDGTGAWVGLDIVDGVVGSFPVGATPGATNASSVSDWTMFN